MTEYAYRFTINSNLIDEDLYNFPIMINLSATSGTSGINTTAIFDLLGENKLKFKVETEDGVQCPVEIEHWDAVNKKAVLWVKVPLISATANTTLTLTYDAVIDDNTVFVGLTGSAIAQSVWDSHFVAVYDMAQDPSGGAGCILDSTVNANHGTPYGSMTSDDLVDGLIGKAIEFDGVDDYIAVPHDASMAFAVTGGLTIEASIYPDVSSDNMHYICVKNSIPNDFNYGLRINALLIDSPYRDSADLSYVISRSDDINIVNSQWQSIVAKHTGTTFDLYKNGVILDSTVYIGSVTDVGSGQFVPNPFYIGTQGTDKIRFFKGLIKNIRISDIARSDAWIKATNLSNTDSLLEVGVPLYVYSGYLTKDNVPVSRQVRLHNRETGSVVAETTSDVITGQFELVSYLDEVCYAVFLPELDDEYNIIIRDKISLYYAGYR